MFRVLFLLVLALQASPQIRWKSEVRQAADGTNQIVLTGDLDEGIDHVTGTVSYMPCLGEACYLPVDWDFEEFFTAQQSGVGSGLGNVLLRRTPPTDSDKSAVKQDVAGGSGTSAPENRGLWALILEAILWGFAMLLTPCVFPMVPMTVSFFMKGSETPRQGRLKAFLYGLFIILLYTVPISLIIGITWVVGGRGVTADIFNWLSTHWLPNIIFFLVFMAFAASFFGAFEITLPSKWTNSADKNSDRKGLGGIFTWPLPWSWSASAVPVRSSGRS